ncbi:MAG TPA: arginine deiminase-related protein [Steroidobacteraceae bacterium]|nr:arginine deiminase-related protein [Steroidobacteraceae bacterium]
MSSDIPAESRDERAGRRQCAEAVLMVRPASFGYNPETAATNRLQRPPVGIGGAQTALARKEHDGLAAALTSEGVGICLVEDTPEPAKPDAVFPNNWVSFHEDGTVVLYPMQAESRRKERRTDVLETVADRLGFTVTRVVDLTPHEAQGRYLEGTGSLVLDHIERTAYACVSPRTDPDVVEEWCRELGYEPVTFSAVDRTGVPLYHTNVLLCIGEKVVVVGAEAIVPADRQRVIDRLRGTGREVIEIGHQEIEHFAGNMLELGTWDEALGDCRVLVMSEAARHALAPEKFARLSACTDEVLAVPVPTIERLGGGSVRCMLAEVFLPA